MVTTKPSSFRLCHLYNKIKITRVVNITLLQVTVTNDKHEELALEGWVDSYYTMSKRTIAVTTMKDKPLSIKALLLVTAEPLTPH